jgi:TonB family protein
MRLRRSVLVAACVAACAVVELAAVDPFTPARYRTGPVPAMPLQAIGGGQVFLELTVGATGSVVGLTTLRSTPPFTQEVIDAVRAWQFLAADELTDAAVRRPIPSKVLIAGLFRPPALFDGAVAGEPPKDLASASDEIPFPTAAMVAPYPPTALGDGVVLVEVVVQPGGTATNARVIRSAPPFDEPALTAARQWMFRPARLGGQPVATFAYILFGFRQPITC